MTLVSSLLRLNLCTSSNLYDKDGQINQYRSSDGIYTFSDKATNEINTPVLGTWTTKNLSTADINLDGATAGTNSILTSLTEVAQSINKSSNWYCLHNPTFYGVDKRNKCRNNVRMLATFSYFQ